MAQYCSHLDHLVRGTIAGFRVAGMALSISLLLASPSLAESTECPDGPTEFADVTTVSPELLIGLRDGRVLHLPGIEPPRATAQAPERPSAIAAKVRTDLVDVKIGIAPLAPTGRWGTVPALVFADSDDLAAELLGRGDVRFRPERGAQPCRARMLDAEGRARKEGRGVWADPGLRVITAGEDMTGNAWPSTATAGLVVVEGVVASVGETATRTYINLGRVRGGFAISVPKRDKVLMGSDAVISARSVGTRLRVRGLVEQAAGLRIDLSDADALEIVAPAPVASPAPSR